MTSLKDDPLSVTGKLMLKLKFTISATNSQARSKNDVTDGGDKGFSNDSTKALVIKRVTMGEGSKIIRNCVTSFVNDLLSERCV